jgi:single-strand DNA-binding protein
MLNQAQIIGRVGRDPEHNQTNSGNSVASFSIATTEQWKDKATGEKREATEWHRVITFGKLADIANEYVTKGKLVYISGKLTTRKYQAKDGSEKQTTEIIADNLKLLSTIKDSSDKQENKQSSTSEDLKNNSSFDSLDDDIPF